MSRYEYVDDPAPAAPAETGRYEFVDEPAKAPSRSVQNALVNTAAGAIRGAGSIGATLLYPFDKAQDLIMGDRGNNSLSDLILQSQPGYKPKPSRNEERRSDMDAALTTLGADPSSWFYKGGKLGGEVAGTAGVGGTLAKGLGLLGSGPTIANLGQALSTGGFRVGSLAGTPLGVGARIAGGAATGGASAALVDPSTAGTGALIGAALPGATQLAGTIGSAIRRGIVGQVNPEVAQLATRAKELGVTVPADRLTNSRPLNALATGLNYIPFSGRSGSEDAMNSSLNQAVSRTFGQDSSNVTQALRKASDDLGQKFDQTLKGTGVQFDKQLFNDVANVYNTAERELGSDALKPIASQVDELIAKGQTGVIDGQAAYNIKRTLDRIGRQNTPAAFHALELKGVLMDGLNRSLGPDAAAAFAQTRQQYGNMLALEKLAKNGAEGEISAARLANMRNINNKPLQELADISAQFVKPREGQHGGAQRAMVGLAGAASGALGVPIAGLLGGVAAGRLTNGLLNSQIGRDFILAGPQSQAGPLGLLGQSAFRTAPLLSGN